MAPRDPLVASKFPLSREGKNGTVSCEVYGSLAPQITCLVSTSVQKKEKKGYTNPENMNLLIYLNPPGAIFIDAGEDIDTDALTEQMKSSKFKTISLCKGEEVIFIKGDISSLAQRGFNEPMHKIHESAKDSKPAKIT